MSRPKDGQAKRKGAADLGEEEDEKSAAREEEQKHPLPQEVGKDMAAASVCCLHVYVSSLISMCMHQPFSISLLFLFPLLFPPQFCLT